MNKKVEDALNNKAQQTQIRPIEEPTVMPVFFKRWLEDTYNQGFEKKIIDLKATLAEKLQYLLHGKPYIIQHQNDEEADKLVKEMKLQRAMFANEAVLFNNGVSFIVLDKVGATKGKEKIEVRIANVNFPNTITRLGNTIIAAEVWTNIAFDKNKWYLRTVYTADRIENYLHSAEGVAPADAASAETLPLEELNKQLDRNMQIKDSKPNPWGIIPVVEMQYKPTADYSWMGRDPITPAKRLEDKQDILDETVKIMLTEQYVNRTKMLVDREMLNNGDDRQLAKLAKENILGVLKDSGGVDGENKAIEFIQGDPKLEQYWISIKNIISLAVSDLKLSEISEEQSAASATGEIFNKGNDVETANTLQTFRQEAITEIMAKALVMKNNEKSSETELDLEAWNVQLIPNVIMNEAKMTEIVVKQLAAGLINMVQAKVKLEGISPRDAENSLLEEVHEDIVNPTLASVMSFSEGDEDDEEKVDDEENKGEENTKPKGKEVVGKK